MTMRAPILVVGLDACDPAIAHSLAAAGHLPTLRRLFERAARCRVRNPYGLFVGSLWMSSQPGFARTVTIFTAGMRSTLPATCGS